MRVLILTDYFLPGEKAGGSSRSLAALIHHLEEMGDFMIATRDRDLGDTEPYADVPTGVWLQVGRIRCRYLRPSELGPASIGRLLRATDHDVLYLNTLYSPPFSHYPLLLRKSRLVPRRPVVLAPRGQLEPGALGIKPRKKRAFLVVARVMGLFTGVIWHSTGPEETADIRRWFGDREEVREAPNLRIPSPVAAVERPSAGPLRIAFLSRISPKKNLRGALEILSGVRADVVFDIYGPTEEAGYFARCEALMQQLPSNVRATYCGALTHEDVHPTLSRYDVLLLPSHGENYGHVIAEAMAAGCVPLISDRTPWRNLALLGVGWDLPPDDHSAYRAVIEACAAEPAATRNARSRAGSQWMSTVDADPVRVRQSASLFDLESP